MSSTNSSLNIQFLGAAKSVTGSKYLLKTPSTNTLVDCGLFQGLKELRLRNWNPFPFPAPKIHHILLTHAHIDHTGFLPRLVKEGFTGPVYCTPVTVDLLKLLLPDCAHLQEEEALYAAKKGFSKHAHPLPLFTQEDAEKVLSLLQPMAFDTWHNLGPDLSFRYHPAGHILGAASLEMRLGSKRLWFSGDLGRYEDEMLTPPASGEEADYIFLESTYGDRLHAKSNVEETLAAIIHRTAKRGGSLVIPAFAIGRTQSMLYHIDQLEMRGAIPRLPVYIDSPMATNASSIYATVGHGQNLKANIVNSKGELLRSCNTKMVCSVQESKQINEIKSPVIIISASGMATGGRVLHHLAQRLPDARNTILLAGYQAEGTRGRALLNGAEKLKMFGQYIPVKAEIASVSGLSAHADQQDLLRWISTFRRAPKKVFMIHGEGPGLTSLAEQIEARLKWPTYIPNYLESMNL